MTDALTPVRAEGTEGLAAEWRKAMEGVTPGSWSHRWDMDCEHYRGLVLGGEGSDFGMVAEVTEPKDAAWIARCSPDNIAKLLDALAAAESRATASEAKVAGLVGALEQAKRRFKEIACGAAYQPAIHAGAGAIEIDAALSASGPANGADYAGDIEPHDDVDKTVAVVRSAYGWALDTDWRLCGLVAGDMGYAATHIVIAPEDRPLASEAGEQKAGAVQHPDDLAVDRFAATMKAKLAKKRAEGRGGWEDKDDCSNAFLSCLLREHIEKGDPVDVGNLAMMIHQRDERIG